MADQSYDVLVVGASLGGVAAALRAADMGASVCLIDPTDWVGGQFTSQGVSKPDENKYIDTVASTASYRNFRHLVRAWYHNNTNLSAEGKSQPLFNPGGSYDAAQPQFAVEPKLGDTILKQLIQASPRLHWRPNTTVSSVEPNGDAIGAVIAKVPDGTETRYVATYVLDATDLGDLLPMALHPGEYVIGAENDTGEPDRPAEPHADWIQPITFVFAIEHRPEGSGPYTISEPPNYANNLGKYSINDGPSISSMFGPGMNMFNYRQYISAANFDDPSFRYDRTTIDTASNDYGDASIPTGDAAADAQIIASARELSLGYLYWLQTACPRKDGSGRSGFPELRPATEAFGTGDGMAPAPYIRESRRIKALKTILEQEIQQHGNPGPRAQLFEDSCGVGTYAYMDVHALPGKNMGGNWIPTWPLQIPMRALVPQRVTNLLASCKNLGTTHLTNGIYRLHPLEWNIGESAGALAAYCISEKTTPHAIASAFDAGDPHLVRGYQRALLAQGVPLFWWTDVLPGDPAWEAVQMAGVTGKMTGDGNAEMKFNPNDALDDAARAALGVPANVTSRGQAAIWLYQQGIT
jgi:hypothetical protein